MLWKEHWLPDTTADAQRDLWRGVEAQHRVATMRLVDSLDEQALLEHLLEDSKPKLPPGAVHLQYLLSTPFRYVSDWPSRFRRANEPGVWYGAEGPATVAAELAHWRWKFFMDSDGLRPGSLVTEHTFFQARFSGIELDITRAPWSGHRDAWRNLNDYNHCQQLACHVRGLAAPVESIRYESARREDAICQVVFGPQTLSLPKLRVQQTWVCKMTASRVLFSHDADMLQFDRAAE